MVELNCAADLQKKKKSILFYWELDTFSSRIYTFECSLHTLQMHFQCASVSLAAYFVEQNVGIGATLRKMTEDLPNDEVIWRV